jgi:hypothetical protein
MQTQLLDIRLGSYKDVAQAAALLDEHWIELAKNKDLMVLSPALERYEAMENADFMFTLCAYLDGELIGYSTNFIVTHMHYSGLLVCSNDLLFISKPYRNSSLGGNLIRVTEEEAVKRGAKLMLWHAKENTPLSACLPKMGCKVQEVIYSKEL